MLKQYSAACAALHQNYKMEFKYAYACSVEKAIYQAQSLK